LFNPSRRLIWLALICALVFMAGMVKLFLLRFEAGNVYPAYSSLRSDPLGTLALYESLQRLPAEAVSRNFRPLKRVMMAPHSTFMIIGSRGLPSFLRDKKKNSLLDNLSQSGGRLVLTFTPATPFQGSEDKKGEAKDNTREKTDGKKPETAEDKTEAETKEEDCTCDAGFETLGFRFNTPIGEDWDDHANRLSRAPEILPPSIPWRAPLSFRLEDDSWEALYTWQGEPVVVQRPWGKGTLVMVADSYLLSNEALRNNRYTGLLTWLVHPGNAIVFDETLKGVVKQPGMAGLARQYRLHGIFAAVLAVVGLFIWRQSAIFIAPVQTEKDPVHTRPAAGRDTRRGLVYLAQQHIDIRSLMTVCLKAWKGQAAQRLSADRIAEVEAMVAEAAADPRKEKQVKTYIEICELLKQGKRS
jgi:hypothetical protein